jgi:hypothetical protein
MRSDLPRRMPRLTNALSKKVASHRRAMALHFLYYNFVRIHVTLRTTPAMAAGVTKRLWEIGDIVAVLENREASSLANSRIGRDRAAE